MTASWALYCVEVAALLALAGLAGEAALRAAGRPVRWAWALSLAGTLVLPWAAWLRRAAPPEAVPAGNPGVLPVLALPDLAAGAVSPSLSRLLLVGWLGASLAVFGVVAWGHWRLRLARRAWGRGVVEGVPVYVSSDLGPAALGFFRGVIVLPEWALELDARLRRLMLLHEREHLRAGDPRLLWLGVAAVVAMPWNPVVWWQWRRLRLAIELDCDARVLGRVADARAYGALLLEVGRRRSGVGPAAAALAEPRSTLERRIRMMLRPKTRGGAVRAVGPAVLTIGLAVLACEAPEPTEEAGVGPDAAADVAAGQAFEAFTPEHQRPELRNLEEVYRALNESYPPLLRDAGIGGTAMIAFWIDASGAVSRYELAQSSGREELDAAALKVAERMEFAPAAKDGRPVPVMVTIPISFRVE